MNLYTLQKKNELIFERAICIPGNSTKAITKECFLKRAGHIGTDLVNFSWDFNVVKPITQFFLHVQFFFKYQVYKTFPVNLWENLCGWLNKESKSYLLDLSFGKAMKYLKYDGGDFKCPIKIGNMSIKFNNISFNEHFPILFLLPSGHYRIDVTITEGNRSIVFLQGNFFFAISDNRLEQY